MWYTSAILTWYLAEFSDICIWTFTVAIHTLTTIQTWLQAHCNEKQNIETPQVSHIATSDHLHVPTP